MRIYVRLAQTKVNLNKRQVAANQLSPTLPAADSAILPCFCLPIQLLIKVQYKYIKCT